MVLDVWDAFMNAMKEQGRKFSNGVEVIDAFDKWSLGRGRI
jgi:hypothetical protein